MYKMTITEEIENGDIIVPNIFEKDILLKMNFIELKSLENKLKKNLSQAKSVLEMTRGLSDMKNTFNDVQNDFEMTDYFISSGIRSIETDINKYRNNYNQLKDDTIKNISLINEVINEKYKDKLSSSTIQKELLEIINKKIYKLSLEKEKLYSSGKMDYSYLSKIENKQKDLQSIIKAINDKEEMEYWKNRTINKKVYIILMKDMLKNFEKNSEFTKNILENYFYPEKAEKIFNTLTPMIDHHNNIEKLYRSIFSIYVLLYDVARRNNSHNTISSKNWYSRVFIMNILEYSNNIYDLHVEDPEWLKNTISLYVSNLVSYSEFIPFDKIKKLIQNSIDIRTYYYETKVETKIEIFPFKK